MNISYKYLKYPNLYKYDNEFTNKYYFKDETEYDNSTFVLSKSCRFAINIYNIDKYIYINTINYTQIDDGFIISSIDCNLLLINVGENVFYLAHCNHKNKLLIHSMIYTFMKNNNCIVDVTKYKFLFENNFIIPLFEKAK